MKVNFYNIENKVLVWVFLEEFYNVKLQLKVYSFPNEELLFHRAEIINYYANLTKEATLREERAMWKIRRGVLDQARQDFLSEDEQAWRDEMEANPEVIKTHSWFTTVEYTYKKIAELNYIVMVNQVLL